MVTHYTANYNIIGIYAIESVYSVYSCGNLDLNSTLYKRSQGRLPNMSPKMLFNYHRIIVCKINPVNWTAPSKKQPTVLCFLFYQHEVCFCFCNYFSTLSTVSVVLFHLLFVLSHRWYNLTYLALTLFKQLVKSIRKAIRIVSAQGVPLSLLYQILHSKFPKCYHRILLT